MYHKHMKWLPPLAVLSNQNKIQDHHWYHLNTAQYNKKLNKPRLRAKIWYPHSCGEPNELIYIAKAFWMSERMTLISQQESARACLPHHLPFKQCKGIIINNGYMMIRWTSGERVPSKSSSSKSISSSSSSSDPSVTGAAPFCGKKESRICRWMKQKLSLNGVSTSYRLCSSVEKTIVRYFCPSSDIGG